MANKKAKRAPKALNIALVVLGAAIIGFAAWAVANAVGAEKQPEDILNSGNIVIEPVEAPEIEDKAFMDGLVTVEKVGRYAGIFVEDGSDEIVSDVFAITVVNNSDKMLQYAQVVITCGGEEYTFDMSTRRCSCSSARKEQKSPPGGSFRCSNGAHHRYGVPGSAVHIPGGV